jgi:UDP-N-acetyl-D-galactosamine dehydrogenase
MVGSIDVYDPLVRSVDAEAELGIALSAEPPSQHYDCVILAVPHEEFLQRGPDWVRSLCRQPCLVYDIKSALVPGLVDKTL